MSVALSCSVPERHSPPHLTVENHHVLVVAWQQFWAPPVAPFPGHDPEGRGPLWDNRTITLCPSHHRNVHALIMALMHKTALLNIDEVPGTPFPGLPSKALRSHRHELEFAKLGLQRMLDAGGSLLALAAAGMWGEA